MSIIIQEDQLKSMPDQALASELENPSGGFPQYLVFAELNRRADLRKRYSEQKAQAPASTMAEEMVSQVMGGAPQAQPMQMMRDGGVVGYSNGGYAPPPGAFAQGNVNDEMNRLSSELATLKRGRSLFDFSPDPRIEAIENRLKELRASQKQIPYPKGSIAGEISDYYGRREREQEAMEAGVERRMIDDPNIVYPPRPTDTGEGVGDGGNGDNKLTDNNLDVIPLLPTPTEPSVDYLAEYKTMLDQLKPTPNEDLPAFRKLLEEYSPEPSRSAAGGRALMSIGQGLLSQPTFAAGLAAGLPGVIESSLIYGREQDEYNKNRRVAEMALFETQEARRISDEDRLFQGRTAAARMGTQLKGDELTASSYMNRARLSDISDQITSIDEMLSNPAVFADNTTEEGKARIAELERRRRALEAERRSIYGINPRLSVP